jgi:hypothetical protein
MSVSSSSLYTSSMGYLTGLFLATCLACNYDAPTSITNSFDSEFLDFVTNGKFRIYFSTIIVYITQIWQCSFTAGLGLYLMDKIKQKHERKQSDSHSPSSSAESKQLEENKVKDQTNSSHHLLLVITSVCSVLFSGVLPSVSLSFVSALTYYCTDERFVSLDSDCLSHARLWYGYSLILLNGAALFVTASVLPPLYLIWKHEIFSVKWRRFLLISETLALVAHGMAGISYWHSGILMPALAGVYLLPATEIFYFVFMAIAISREENKIQEKVIVAINTPLLNS